MTDLPTPQTKRLQRPSWRDSRLVVGVLLVLLAATLGAKAVSSADDRVPHYVAAGNLVAGDQLTAASVVRADVRLDDDVADYLLAGGALSDGMFLVRDVRQGELIPISAVGTAQDLKTQRVTVEVDAVSATGLAAGSVVDVFVSSVPEGAATGARPKADKALDSVRVGKVIAGTGGFGSNAITSVQLLVPIDKVESIVESIDAKAKLTLVPVAGSPTSPAS
ncbi:MAG: hypothetical protein L0H25_07925 [Micrococcales bacterium]|nr:hypothetical protein [Micrococcales bacterium]